MGRFTTVPRFFHLWIVALTIDVRLSFSTVSFSLLDFLRQVLFKVVSSKQSVEFSLQGNLYVGYKLPNESVLRLNYCENLVSLGDVQNISVIM